MVKVEIMDYGDDASDGGGQSAFFRILSVCTKASNNPRHSHTSDTCHPKAATTTCFLPCKTVYSSANLFEVVARVENYGREENKEKKFRLGVGERGFTREREHGTTYRHQRRNDDGPRTAKNQAPFRLLRRR